MHTASEEVWKEVVNFPNYEVSNFGNVRRKPLLMKPGSIPSGHLTVALSVGDGKPKSVYVHRLVATAFIENVENKPLVNHKNGNPKDNRLENLEWNTYSENISHGYKSNGRRVPTELKVCAVDKDGQIFASFRSITDAARLFNVSPPSIRTAMLRKGTSCGYRWMKI